MATKTSGHGKRKTDDKLSANISFEAFVSGISKVKPVQKAAKAGVAAAAKRPIKSTASSGSKTRKKS